MAFLAPVPHTCRPDVADRTAHGSPTVLELPDLRGLLVAGARGHRDLRAAEAACAGLVRGRPARAYHAILRLPMQASLLPCSHLRRQPAPALCRLHRALGSCTRCLTTSLNWPR